MQVFPATFGAKSDQRSLTIFGESNLLKITRFQRTYTWDDPQWELLLDDLHYMAEENEMVAWPSLILQQVRDISLPNHRVYWIGDGQQRITTVYLCLLAIWQSARGRALQGSQDESGWTAAILPTPEVHAVGSKGYLGDVIQGKYSPKIDPKLRFFSKALQDDIALLLEPLRESSWIKMDARIESADETSGIFRAFRRFYDWAESYTLEELEGFADLILNNIQLSAVVFSESENMERAYGNMNSGGAPLTEDELVKARIYSMLKTHHSQELADAMADYWIREFESDEWWLEQGKVKRGSILRSRVYEFLEEKYRLDTKWEIEARRYTADWTAKTKIHWLSSNWATQLNELQKDAHSIEQFWLEFQEDKDNFETIKGKTIGSCPKGSVNWIAYYALPIMGNSSVLMYLLRSIEDEDELKRTLWLFIRYCLFLRVVANEGNFLQVLIKGGSPLRDPLSYETLLAWFSNAQNKAKWISEEEIRTRLAEREFRASYNSSLTHLFTYVNNCKAEANRNRESLFAHDLNSLDPQKSREHILSQKPSGYEKWSETERKKHDEIVGRLGNVLIISSSKNSALQNKPVEDKLAIYRSETNSLVGSFWVQDFLDDYEDEDGVWGAEAIEKRSAKLAKLIAPYLSNPSAQISSEEEGTSDQLISSAESTNIRKLVETLQEDPLFIPAEKSSDPEEVSGE